MSDSLQHLSTSELGERFATATTSDEAARIAAELEQRALHLEAAAQLRRRTFLTFANGSRWEYRRRTAGGMLELRAVDERGLYAGASLTLPLAELAARMSGQDCSSSPLAALPPAIRATFTPAERLELANYCGPDSARTCPMDTGREHAPIAEHVRLAVSDAPRGWLLASEDAGRVSLVLWRRGPAQTWPSRPMRLHTLETRLGW